MVRDIALTHGARKLCIVAWGPGLGTGLAQKQGLTQTPTKRQGLSNFGSGSGARGAIGGNSAGNSSGLSDEPPGNHLLIFDAYELTCVWSSPEPTMPFFRQLVGLYPLHVDPTLRLAFVNYLQTNNTTTTTTKPTTATKINRKGNGNKAGLGSGLGSGLGLGCGLGCTLVQVGNTRLPPSSLPSPPPLANAADGDGVRGDGGVLSLDLCTIVVHHIEEITANDEGHSKERQGVRVGAMLVGHCVLPVAARLSCILDDGLGPGQGLGSGSGQGLGQGLGHGSEVTKVSGLGLGSGSGSGGEGGLCGKATVILCNDNTLRIIDIGQGQGLGHGQGQGQGLGSGTSHSAHSSSTAQLAQRSSNNAHTGGVVSVAAEHVLSGYATSYTLASNTPSYTPTYSPSYIPTFTFASNTPLLTPASPSLL